MATKLTLHNYWRSSASHRVRIGLGWKELAYDYVAVNIATGAQHSDAYRKRNALAQVPTLEVEDGSYDAPILITQSLPILEYLEDRWPERPLLPRDLYLRARARSLAEIVNSGIQPLQNLTTLARVKELGGDGTMWVRGFITDGLVAFARAMSDVTGKFCVGDSPSIADACLVPQLASVRRFGVDPAKLDPRLFEIEARCLALPAFAAAAPERQPDAVVS